MASSWEQDGPALVEEVLGVRPEISPQILNDLHLYLEREFRKYSLPGQLSLSDLALHYEEGGLQFQVPLEDWIYHFHEMDFDTRRLRVEQLIRQLLTQLPRRAPKKPPWTSRIGSVLVPGAITLALGYFAYSTFLDPHAGQEENGRVASSRVQRTGAEQALPNDAASSPKSGAESGKRAAGLASAAGLARPAALTEAQAACFRTRNRAIRGGTVGLADTDGWQVELLLAKSGKGNWPAEADLAPYFSAADAEQRRKYHWKEEPQLDPIQAKSSQVRLSERVELATSSEPGSSAVLMAKLVFSGPIVDSYFDGKKRGSYFHLAQSLKSNLAADAAALYAHCEGDETHHVGSWFQGSQAGDAAAILVYSMGLSAYPSHLIDAYRLDKEGKESASWAWQNIEERAQHLDRAMLVQLVGTTGGDVLGAPNQPVSIVFPFRDANRASRASKVVAQALSLSK